MSGEYTDSYEVSSEFFTGALMNISFSVNTTNNCSMRNCLQKSNINKRVFGGDGSAVLRILISVIYSVVCALGLTGNMLVLYLMKSKHVRKKTSINVFVTSLAVTDIQFVLTLPFWAVENALDFRWVFGKAMCKMVSYVTAMNMYASVFFLTAMSVARYWSVASALGRKTRGRTRRCSAKCISVVIWCAAVSAALPHVVYSTTATVSDEELCLVRFPDTFGNAQFWLGLYHAQKVLLGFVIPLGVITVYYLLLLRFITSKNVNNSSALRRSKVTRSVAVVVLSFFLCWLPNQALTAWGILIKLNLVDFSSAYYTTQAYVFPVSVCLAHSNSCLNPILYCLMRREFRKELTKLLWRITSPSVTSTRLFTVTSGPEQDEQGHVLVPVNASEEPVVFYPPGAVVYNNRNQLLPNST